MTKERFNQIFTEELNRFLMEKKQKGGDDKDNTDKRLGELLGKLDSIEKKKGNKKENLRTKKLRGGLHQAYNYDEYKENNPETAKADSDNVRHNVDMKRNNISDIAQDIFPDHTPAGAQSQLRKILKGERKMTKKVADELADGLNSGEIAYA